MFLDIPIVHRGARKLNTKAKPGSQPFTGIQYSAVCLQILDFVPTVRETPESVAGRIPEVAWGRRREADDDAEAKSTREGSKYYKRVGEHIAHRTFRNT